ncbi:MAG: sulfatase-like hydrolase/transferase [Phycisphaerales bacterium]|nr:sulfatase-like hydrolase/transferase [Phycisphaerales bacterium]
MSESRSASGSAPRRSRRQFIKGAGAAAAALALPRSIFADERQARKPNIIFIMADDLGYAELGCCGQRKIRTPNLDRLAAEGVRFTQFYSGSTVCAPSRCCLLTGKHTGHAYIRDNGELPTEGQWPLPHDTPTIGRMLQRAGYATGAIGKWGLGGPGSTGEPNQQGFDHWFGYLCQRQAHNYYPTYLWRNGQKVPLDNPTFSAHQRLDGVPDAPGGFDRFNGSSYAPDLMINEALEFVRENQKRPFFLYYATIVPHLAIQVPEDSLAEYGGKWPETPYLGDRGYLPHPTPRAGYAAMVTRMDRDIGRLLDLLEELGLADDTLVMFTSDNGATFDIGGYDPEFFEGTGPLRGHKTNLYEGGIRVPLIAHWPGHIRPGTTTSHVAALWDVLLTLAEVAGVQPRSDTDGVSFLPTLLGQSAQKQHPYLYWEFRSGGGSQAVRMGRWKGLRRNLTRQRNAPIELYDLETDIGETKNLADQHPEIVHKIARIMQSARTESEHFPLLPPPPPALSDLPTIPKDNWRLVRVDSESDFNGMMGRLAFDGDESTHWHTQWKDAQPDHPHELVIDLGQRREIQGFRYLPRTDGGVNGTIREFEFFVGDDPDRLGQPVAAGRFALATYEQEILFARTAGRYICIRSRSEIHGKPFACIAELTLLGQ